MKKFLLSTVVMLLLMMQSATVLRAQSLKAVKEEDLDKVGERNVESLR